MELREKEHRVASEELVQRQEKNWVVSKGDEGDDTAS